MEVKLGDKVAITGIVRAITEEETVNGIKKTITIKFPEAELWNNTIVIIESKI